MGKDCLDYALCGSYIGTATLHSPFHRAGLYVPDIYSPNFGAMGEKGKHCVQHLATLACLTHTHIHTHSHTYTHTPLPLAAFFLFAPLAAPLMTPQSPPLSPLLDPPGAFLFGGVPEMTWKLRPAFLLLGKSLRLGIGQKAAGTSLSLLITWDKHSAEQSQIGSIPLRDHVCSFQRCCLISFLVLLFRTSFHFRFWAIGPASTSTFFNLFTSIGYPWHLRCEYIDGMINY